MKETQWRVQEKSHVYMSELYNTVALLKIHKEIINDLRNDIKKTNHLY